MRRPRATPSARVLCAIVTAVAIAVAALGCGDEESPPTSAVPGGAVAKTPAGTPGFCSTLTDSDPVRNLGRTLSGLARSATAAEARSELRDAADSLADLAPASNRALRRWFTKAARTLRAAAAHGPANARTMTRVASAFRGLGGRLQGVCKFPRG